MIPQEFEYEHPSSVADAIAMLGKHGGEARILAGGHSLVPLMKLRLAAPDALIDIGGIASLRGITDTPDAITIGALTTHAQVAGSDVVAGGCPILAETAAGIGDSQVRNRGTIGGSLANADPHGDLPAVFLALGGEVTAEGPGGQRTISAADLFVDYLQTSLSADEIITAVRVPKAAKSAYVKFNRRAQDWAVVGAAAVVDGRLGPDRADRRRGDAGAGDGGRGGVLGRQRGRGRGARRRRARPAVRHGGLGRVSGAPGEGAGAQGPRSRARAVADEVLERVRGPGGPRRRLHDPDGRARRRRVPARGLDRR